MKPDEQRRKQMLQERGSDLLQGDKLWPTRPRPSLSQRVTFVGSLSCKRIICSPTQHLHNARPLPTQTHPRKQGPQRTIRPQRKGRQGLQRKLAGEWGCREFGPQQPGTGTELDHSPPLTWTATLDLLPHPWHLPPLGRVTLAPRAGVAAGHSPL